MADVPPPTPSQPIRKTPTSGPPPLKAGPVPVAGQPKPGDPNAPLEEDQGAQPIFWQQPWVQNALPLATSVAVHLGLFILGLIFLAAAHRLVFKEAFKDQAIIPDAQLAQDDNFGGIPNPGMGVDPNQKAAQDQDQSQEHGFADHKSDITQTLAGGGADGSDVIAAGEGNGPGHGSGTGSGIGTGIGGGNGTGGGPEADFGPKNAGGPAGPQSKLFGHGSNVKSIVYIVDGSGSLVGGKDEALRMELKKAVTRLVLVQSFNVIQFQHGENKTKFVALAEDLLVAKPANKSKLFNFVDNTMVFHGETNPLPAIREAFREHPQLIFLLTDGAFEDNDPDEKADADTVIKTIADLNKDKRVHVNTILLIKNKSELDDAELKAAVETMKKIAADNGGVYTTGIADDL